MPWWYYKGKITKPVNNGKNVVIIKPGDEFEASSAAVNDLKRLGLVVDITKRKEIQILREKRKFEKLKLLEEKKQAQLEAERKEREKKLEKFYNKIEVESKSAPKKPGRRRKKKIQPEQVEILASEDKNKDQSIVVEEKPLEQEQKEQSVE